MMSKAPKSLQTVVSEYGARRPNYESLARYVADLLKRSSSKGLIHTVEHRAKEIISFQNKCQKLNSDGSLRYPAAPAGISDLAGVRVIVFTRDSVDVACSLIEELFEVFDVEDVGDRVYQQGRFGYQSKHLLLRLGSDRRDLRENAEFRDFVCEVQVRTILQHAWAELEHDIQYKTTQDIPLDLNKRFSALAGLLEIADREFQTIQNESAAVKDHVRAGLLSDLTKEGLGKEKGAGAPEPAETVRSLITQGRIQDAIRSFDERIARSPTSYTHYIGRAKARFLMGEVTGAVSDLDMADELSGSPVFTERLRDLIKNGDTKQIASSYRANPVEVGEEEKRATKALAMGDGFKAFEHYEALDAINYKRAIVLYGKAACCALERDTTGALAFLGALELRPGTIMAVNLLALRAVISILEASATDIDELDEALKSTPQFSIGASPMKSLFAGFRIKAYAETDAILLVEKALSESSPD